MAAVAMAAVAAPACAGRVSSGVARSGVGASWGSIRSSAGEPRNKRTEERKNAANDCSLSFASPPVTVASPTRAPRVRAFDVLCDRRELAKRGFRTRAGIAAVGFFRLGTPKSCGCYDVALRRLKSERGIYFFFSFSPDLTSSIASPPPPSTESAPLLDLTLSSPSKSSSPHRALSIHRVTFKLRRRQAHLAEAAGRPAGPSDGRGAWRRPRRY